MSAASPRSTDHVSEIPASQEQSSGITSFAPRTAPVLWLDRLLQASARAPYELGPRVVVERLLQSAHEVMPEMGLGFTMRLPEGGELFAVVAPGEEAATPEGWPRVAVPGLDEAFVTWNCPEGMAPGSSESLLVQALALVVGPAVRLAIATRQLEALTTLRQQLTQAEKLATAGRLAAGSLHEINNPLTSILSYADFLHRKSEGMPLEAEDLERLQRIQASAERIRRLTRNFLDYARPSDERTTLLSLRTILDQAQVFCDHLLRSGGVIVEREIQGEEPYLRGAGDELTQVFVNLITNACHAMARGGGRLGLRVSTQGAWLVVEVSDNGHGIAPEHLTHVFEPFFTTKTLGSGTGLGLSIVRTIVERHQGSIEVQSEPGNGATFVLMLPRLAP